MRFAVFPSSALSPSSSAFVWLVAEALVLAPQKRRWRPRLSCTQLALFPTVRLELPILRPFLSPGELLLTPLRFHRELYRGVSVSAQRARFRERLPQRNSPALRFKSAILLRRIKVGHTLSKLMWRLRVTRSRSSRLLYRAERSAPPTPQC